MKSIKVLYHGKRLKDLYPYASRFEVFKWKCYRFFRKLAIIAIAIGLVSGIAYGAFKSGSLASEAQVVYAVKEVIKEVAVVDAPILDKIAKCESGGTHYKNGQVVVNGNTNGSVDIGKYQINLSVWGATATKMGLDLAKEEDNKKFAEWLYANKGTEPWVWSKSCWNK